MMVSKIRALLAFLCVFTIAACSPIDKYEDGLERVESAVKKGTYKKNVDATEKSIKSLSDKETYLALVKDEDFLKRKNALMVHVNSISEGAKKLRAMESMDDNPANVAKAGNLYSGITSNESKLRVGLRNWTKEYSHIKNIIERADSELALVSGEYAKFNTSKTVTLSKIQKAKSDFPHQAERLSTFEKHLNDFDKTFSFLVKFLESPIKDRKLENYQNYVSVFEKINVRKNAGLSLSDDYQRMVSQLYSSYSKILVDMNEDHGLALGAVSWDEYYDYPTEHRVNFPYTEVSKADLDRALRRYQNGFQDQIYRLKSDEFLSKLTGGRSKTAWHGGDDAAEIWLEDYESEFTHVYNVIENGKMTQIEESVSEGTYRKLKGSVGQEVLSKPYGKFEDELIDEPQSPGMNYVGNPHYGQWQKDPISGTDIWMWFAAYSIMDDIIDDRIDRRRHERYMASMNTYVPPRQRRGYSSTNAFGVTSANSPIQKSLFKSKNSNLRGAGASFRNRGSSSGK